jgi:2-desacetyl-2-hydroxyethyl bacteriochlorophyllide A dehydrogenase
MTERTFIRYDGPHESAVVVETAPEPGPGEFVLESVVSALSPGTERMWFTGTAPALQSGRKSFPYTPGYAVVGRVAAVGEGVSVVAPGDRLFAMKPHASINMVTVGRDFFVPLADSVSDVDALAIALTGTTWNAARRGRLASHERVCVVGFGLVGGIMAQVAARSFGAAVTVSTAGGQRPANGFDDIAFLEDGDPTGFDVVFECTGTPSGVDRGIELAGDQARIVATGFYVEPLLVDGEALFTRELEIIGVRAAGGVFGGPTGTVDVRAENLAGASSAVMTGEVIAEPLLTHRFAATNYTGAMTAILDPHVRHGLILLDWATAP